MLSFSMFRFQCVVFMSNPTVGQNHLHPTRSPVACSYDVRWGVSDSLLVYRDLEFKRATLYSVSVCVCVCVRVGLFGVRVCVSVCVRAVCARVCVLQCVCHVLSLCCSAL